MAGLATPNIVGHMLEITVRDARNGEYAGTPFTDVDGTGQYDGPYLGCNRAGSCAPGIGINTGDYDPELRAWDAPPDRVARLNQESAHIGSGDAGLANPGNGPDYPSSGITTDPVRTARNVGGSEDYTDTFGFQQAGVAVAPGAAIANGVINRTGKTIPAGSWAWGTVTNA